MHQGSPSSVWAHSSSKPRTGSAQRGNSSVRFPTLERSKNIASFIEIATVTRAEEWRVEAETPGRGSQGKAPDRPRHQGLPRPVWARGLPLATGRARIIESCAGGSQCLLLIGAVERHASSFVIQATDGTGVQPGSSPPRPLGVKPGRPLSYRDRLPWLAPRAGAPNPAE